MVEYRLPLASGLKSTSTTPVLWITEDNVILYVNKYRYILRVITNWFKNRSDRIFVWFQSSSLRLLSTCYSLCIATYFSHLVCIEESNGPVIVTFCQFCTSVLALRCAFVESNLLDQILMRAGSESEKLSSLTHTVQ